MSRIADRRKSSSEEDSGGAYWMDTYGDMVTLLLCFFVFLFSFSTIDAEKWQRLVGAFTGANSMVVPVMDLEAVMSPAIPSIPSSADGDGKTRDMTELEQRNQKNFLELYTNLNAYITEHDLQAELHYNQDNHTIIVRFMENVLFDSGRAEIRSEGLPTMNHIINALNQNEELIEMISIEGHTDNNPINTYQFKDNWDLSVARAVTVLRYFLDSGRIDSSRISAVGYGEEHPVMPNDSVEGRAANRRVDFVLESLTLTE